MCARGVALLRVMRLCFGVTARTDAPVNWMLEVSMARCQFVEGISDDDPEE